MGGYARLYRASHTIGPAIGISVIAAIQSRNRVTGILFRYPDTLKTATRNSAKANAVAKVNAVWANPFTGCPPGCCTSSAALSFEGSQ